MRVVLQTLLAAPTDRVWAEVNRTRLLDYVAWPMLKFQPVSPLKLPEKWQPGEFEVRMFAFDIVPVGRQWIVISFPDTQLPARELLDDGRGSLLSRWHHLIRVEPDGAGGTCYTDDVDVRAGVLTPCVWLFARVFYAQRQRRWRKLVKEGFTYA